MARDRQAKSTAEGALRLRCCLARLSLACCAEHTPRHVLLALPQNGLVVDPSLRTVLEQFEVAILSDPSVLGVLYTGSLGRGTADRFSDLDLEVWLADDAFADLPAKTRDLHAVLGTIELFEVRHPRAIRT